MKLFLILPILFAATGVCAAAPGSPENVIPVPSEISSDGNTLILPACNLTFAICADKENRESGRTCSLSEYISELQMVRTEDVRHADIDIYIGTKYLSGRNAFAGSGNSEAYLLDVSGKGITIRAAKPAGALYAMQTLRQMTENFRNREIRCCTVKDSPRFGYRGMMVDVSRHFRSKEFLMKQIDAMALLKLNRMHLHLTDDAGWRLESEAYPRLTEYTAWRPYRKWSDWTENGGQYCGEVPGAYGGCYTREDMKEVIAYASARNIEIVPEIEMPGHSREVTTAYPEISCSGIPHKDYDLCPGKEETFRFIETVLDEVISLFPGRYIHIGGDEAGKNAWHDCPDCRRRMEEEGLAGVEELQSYLIKRVGRFLESRGKEMIGWDEILQGGLASQATVMSWRGPEGGFEALRKGNDAILCPNEFCYLDYAQDARFKEPVSMGGYTPLEKVYSFEPEDGMPADTEGKLLGIQGNLWVEYITEDKHAEYMYYPRIYAIAETGWSEPGRKDYGSFRDRALAFNRLLQEEGFNTFDLANEYGQRKESLKPVVHKAVGKKVTYNTMHEKQYAGTGETTLTDGIVGGWTYGDRKWQGWLSDMDVTVDMGAVTDIHYIGATFMQSMQAWVYMPENVVISVSSDGEHFRTVETIYNDLPQNTPDLFFKPFQTVCDLQARYVRITAKNRNTPGGFWLFTDEVVIN